MASIITRDRNSGRCAGCRIFNMTDLKEMRLTLFFSAGVGLRIWKENGSMRRELELYKRLSSRLGKVNFVTYGGRSDGLFREELGGIGLASAGWLHRPFRLSGLMMPLNIASMLLNCSDTIKNTDVIKTNQISGSEMAVLAKRLYNKKLFLRCGYVPSRLWDIARSSGISTENLGRINTVIAREKNAFTNADMISVPTENDRIWIVEKYRVGPGAVRVIPNYVETDRFKPMPEVAKRYDLVFVGRSSGEKNLSGLIEAARLLSNKRKLSILFIGSCGRSPMVEEALKTGLISGDAIGNIDNAELPGALAMARIFIITSFYEGNSKVLIEAMSCGLPCIGTNVDSINTVISHRKNGYLCATKADSIAEAIDTVLGDPKLCGELGQSARNYVKDKFDISKVLDMELDVLNDICKGCV